MDWQGVVKENEKRGGGILTGMTLVLFYLEYWMILVWRQPFCSCVLLNISEIIFIRFLNFSSKVRKYMEERIKERIKG